MAFTYDPRARAERLIAFYGSAVSAYKACRAFERGKAFLQLDRRERLQHEALVSVLAVMARRAL